MKLLNQLYSNNSMMTRKDLIVKTLSYFHHFHTPITLAQIHTFYPKAIDLSSLERRVVLLCKERILHKDYIDNDLYYTLGGIVEIREHKRSKILTKKKLQKVQTYLSILKNISIIDFIGLSGSLAMDAAKKNDDIDLFIICKYHRMWTARLICVFLAYTMGRKRKRSTKNDMDKICLNLFFDGRDISIPTEKRNAYVAHEILQMKVIVTKNRLYERFLYENRWVLDYFPNAVEYYPFAKIRKSPVRSDWLVRKIGDMLECILKAIQLYFIAKHTTTERIYPNQLWFFPHDAEEDVIDLL